MGITRNKNIETKKKKLFGTLPPDVIQIIPEMHDIICTLVNVQPGCGATNQQYKTNYMNVHELHVIPIRFIGIFETVSSCVI